jgi:hypothetical protein
MFSKCHDGELGDLKKCFDTSKDKSGLLRESGRV